MLFSALTFVSACGTVSGGTSRAGVRRFADDTVTVVSPRVDSTVEIGESVSLAPYWTADVITAATPVMSAPDAVTRATEYAETRHEVGAGINRTGDGGSNLNGSYTLSVEPDYVSHTVSARYATEILNRSATVGASVRAGRDAVGRSDDSDFAAVLYISGGALEWTQVVNQRVLVHTVYDLEVRDGYQAHPYRLVPMFDPGGSRPRATLPEQVPSLRVRHAFESTAIWGSRSQWFVRAGYRFYIDDWGIRSHTIEPEVWRPIADDRLRLRLQARGYRQSSANFYRARYERATEHLTGDSRLSSMWTLGGGARMEWRQEAERAETVVGFSYDAIGFFFDEFAVRDRMLAQLFGLNVSVEY